MKGIIVEKQVIDIITGIKKDLYAVATSEPNKHSTIKSLTFEGYLTAWNTDRSLIEALNHTIGIEG